MGLTMEQSSVMGNADQAEQCVNLSPSNPPPPTPRQSGICCVIDLR